MCLYQKSGRRPPPITGRFVNTATRVRGGAPNERASFRIYGAFVGFVDRCLSKTRNLAASNKPLAPFLSGRSWPKIGPGMSFFGVFEKFETFLSKICAHSERYNFFVAGISDVVISFREHRVSMVTGLCAVVFFVSCVIFSYPKLVNSSHYVAMSPCTGYQR